MTSMYRQGDVVLIPVETIPDQATAVARNGRLVLAEGEATGHAHAVLEREASLYELVTDGDQAEMRQRFLKVEAEVALVHEEHATITVPPGDYEVRRLREYAPDRSRFVAD